MSNAVNRQLVIDALFMAIGRRKSAKNLLFHSDQGSQYTSKNYQFLLSTKNITSSMNHKGCCYDNAVSESFFSSLKRESYSLILHNTLHNKLKPQYLNI